MKRSPYGRYALQRGQALAEFIVLALALVPLFLLMPVIAKYQDIAHATQVASRYVTFEATIRNDTINTWKPVNQLEGEVRRRFFSNPDAAIKTGDSAGNFKSHQNLFWRDQRGASLIKDFDNDVKIVFGPKDSPDHASAFSQASDSGPFKAAPIDVSDALGLSARGIYVASVSVVLAKLPAAPGSYTKSYDEFAHTALTITRRTGVLIDSWTARDAEQVEERIDNATLFPGRMLAPAGALVDVAVAIVESPSCFHGGCTRGPKLGKLEFWRDVVPADRLK